MDVKLFSGNSNIQLAKGIADNLGMTLGKAAVKRFSDGEINVEIHESVRGKNVFIIQSTSNPANENIMELLIMVDAFKRASAQSITAVMPYYGYARQDRKVAPRAPISAKLIADILQVAGVNRVLTVDLHAGQIQGFFDIPVDHLYGLTVMVDYIKKEIIERSNNEIVIVSPDAGGVERARAFAKKINAGLAIIDKRRDRPNQSKALHVIGDVKDKIAVIVDDLVDTAGTLCNSVDALLEKGAVSVYACITHPVLSGPAIERLINSKIEKLIVTDTIVLSDNAKQCEKIVVLTVAPLLAEAIRRIYKQDSVSSLFED
jgi:ribose-phosphate pyrophosphokinase